MGSMRHGLAIRYIFWLLMGPLFLDRDVRDLASGKPSLWHRSWRVLQLVSEDLFMSISIPFGTKNTHRMNNFIVGQVTPDMLTHLRYGTYTFFGPFTAMGALFISLFFPETKGLSLVSFDPNITGTSYEANHEL